MIGIEIHLTNSQNQPNIIDTDYAPKGHNHTHKAYPESTGKQVIPIGHRQAGRQADSTDKHILSKFKLYLSTLYRLTQK